MTNAEINIQIDLLNRSIFDGEKLTLIKDFGDGMKAFANPSGSAVAIFAEMEDGDLFNASGWRKHATKSLEELADFIYA